MHPEPHEGAAEVAGRAAEASPLAALWAALRRLPPADRLGGALVAGASLALHVAGYDRGLGPPAEGLLVAAAATIARGGILYRDLAVPLPPLGAHGLAAAFSIFGGTLPAARLVVAAAATVAVLAAYRLARGLLAPAAATAAGLLLVGVHPWARPYAHTVGDGVFALLPALLAMAVTAGGRPAPAPARLAVTGALAGVATLATPHAGVAALAGLAALVVVLPPHRGRLRGIGVLAAGALAALGPTLLFFAAQGTLAAFWRLGVVAPLAAGTARGTVAPTILVVLVTLVAAAVMARRAPTGEDDRATPLLLLLLATSVLFATAAAGAGLTTFLAPTLLLLVVIASDVLAALPTAGRLAGGAVAWLAVAAVLGTSIARVAELRHAADYAVALRGGRLGLPQDEALVLSDLDRFVARTVPPDAPLFVFPPRPFIPLLLGRAPGGEALVAEPLRPDPARDLRLGADLEQSGAATLVYAFPPDPTFAPLAAGAPDLAAYLVEHYQMARVFTASTHGPLFAAFVRQPPPPASPRAYLFHEHLDEAVLTVVPAGGEARTVTGTERSIWVGQDVWPLRRVIALRPMRAPGASALHFVVRIPAGARLHLAYGMNPDRWRDDPPSALTFTVTLRDADGTTGTLAETRVDPQRNLLDRTWHPLDAELAAYADRTVDIALAVSAEDEAGERVDIAGFADAALVD